MEKKGKNKRSFSQQEKQWLQPGFVLPRVFFFSFLFFLSFKAVNSRWCEATLKEKEKRKKKLCLVDYGVQIHPEKTHKDQKLLFSQIGA